MVKLRRPGHATVVAYLSLFVAVGTGGAYASHLVVNGSDVVNESLTGSDVRGKSQTANARAVNGSLTGHDISGQAADAALGQPFVEGSLTGADVQDKSLKGTDVANGSISGSHIQDGSITNLDVLNDVFTEREIVDGSLNDEDVGESTAVDFEANIGVVPARSCIYRPVTGLVSRGDHLLLTPNDVFSSARGIIYGVQYDREDAIAWLQACNVTASQIDDDITRFNLLVIDAQ